MQESSGIITADILVSCKNDHTVPDQQLGCPRKLSGKQYLPLEECQKKDVPEQSYPWYVLETSNTKPFKGITRLEFEARLQHAGQSDHCSPPWP